MGSSDQIHKAAPNGLPTLPDMSNIKDQERRPAMVLRSRSVKNIAERYQLSESALGKSTVTEDISKTRVSPCISRLALLAILLWCLVVLIVLYNIPWGDFELRWVRKKINDVQWLLPLSRQECTAGQE